MKIGVLGHLLLGLLSEAERTGYQLTRDFDVSLANVWAASHSQIYPELAKLEHAGLIRKTDAGPRGSQRYAATDAGRVALRDWLANTLPGDSPRSERMARVFFLGTLPPDHAIGYLAEQVKKHRENLTRYQVFAASHRLADPSTRWTRIALEAGIRSETAMAEWAAWAIECLEKELPQILPPKP